MPAGTVGASLPDGAAERQLLATHANFIAIYQADGTSTLQWANSRDQLCGRSPGYLLVVSNAPGGMTGFFRLDTFDGYVAEISDPSHRDYLGPTRCGPTNPSSRGLPFPAQPKAPTGDFLAVYQADGSSRLLKLTSRDPLCGLGPGYLLVINDRFAIAGSSVDGITGFFRHTGNYGGYVSDIKDASHRYYLGPTTCGSPGPAVDNNANGGPNGTCRTFVHFDKQNLDVPVRVADNKDERENWPKRWKGQWPLQANNTFAPGTGVVLDWGLVQPGITVITPGLSMPEDFIFVGGDQVVQVNANTQTCPPDTDYVCPEYGADYARFVLEVQAGLVDRYHVKKGDPARLVTNCPTPPTPPVQPPVTPVPVPPPTTGPTPPTPVPPTPTPTPTPTVTPACAEVEDIGTYLGTEKLEPDHRQKLDNLDFIHLKVDFAIPAGKQIQRIDMTLRGWAPRFNSEDTWSTDAADQGGNPLDVFVNGVRKSRKALAALSCSASLDLYGRDPDVLSRNESFAVDIRFTDGTSSRVVATI